MRISDWSSDVCSSDLHLRVRQHLAAELDLSHAQRAPAPGFAQPGQVETGELPHRVHAQAAGHHRIALEVAIEEPQVRTYVHLGADLALAERAALAGNACDKVEHQHRRQRQARVAGAEHITAAAGRSAEHTSEIPSLMSHSNAAY